MTEAKEPATYSEIDYMKLLHANDSLQSQNAKLRQQISLHTVEPSTIREENAWNAGWLAYKEGLTLNDNPYTIAREAAAGKKKHG